MVYQEEMEETVFLVKILQKIYLTISEIPKKIFNAPKIIDIRGEVYISKKILKK